MPVRQQTSAPQDDAACRFYGVGGSYALLAVDLSQREDDMLSDANAVFENSARFNYGGPRTMLWSFDALSSTDEGTLWRHGTGGNLELVRISAGGGAVEVYVNTTVVADIPLPATLGVFWIAWITQDNPDPDAGASDARLSWLLFYSEDSELAERHRFTHPAKNLESTTAYVGASSSGGVNACTAQIGMFGFWSRLITLTELANMQWDTTTAPASTVASTERQGLPVESGTFDLQGETHGAAVQTAGAALSHTRWRSMGALYNARFRSPVTIDSVSHANGDDVSKFRTAIDGAPYRMHIGWFRAYKVSPTANALFVRIHASMWAVSGSGVGHFGLRLYAFSRRPVVGGLINGEPPAPLQYRRAGASLSDDNSAASDPGEWRIDQVIPIVRGSSGISLDRVYLAIAYALDPDGTNLVPDADLRLQVNACHVVQLFDGTVGAPPLGGPSGEAG
jgi:hypothetical protein